MCARLPKERPEIVAFMQASAHAGAPERWQLRCLGPNNGDRSPRSGEPGSRRTIFPAMQSGAEFRDSTPLLNASSLISLLSKSQLRIVGPGCSSRRSRDADIRVSEARDSALTPSSPYASVGDFDLRSFSSPEVVQCCEELLLTDVVGGQCRGYGFHTR